MKQADLILKNAYLVSMDAKRTIRNEACIAISGDSIAAVGGNEILAQYTAPRTISLAGQVVFPGFVSTHSHLFQSMLKGLGRDKNLLDWLNSSVRVALYNYDEDTIYYAALVGCLEAIRTGTTTLLDYQYCHPVPGLDEAVLRAFDTVGLRGVLGRSFTNVAAFPPEIACPQVETEQNFLDATSHLAKKLRGNSLLSTCLAPGIIWDHTPDGFKEMRKMADELHIPITMHIVESPDDDAFGLEQYGRRAIPQMEHLGVLGPDFIAVHCVNMEEEDFAAFNRHNVKISYNPTSNMILASGAPPIQRFVEDGLTVSLACDGSASNDSQNMLEVIKNASLLQKVTTRNPLVLPACGVLEMATLGGAAALGKQADIGSVEAGKKADLTVFKPGRFSLPVHDPISALVYASSPENIETVFVGGKAILENGCLTTLDEEKVLYEAQRLAQRLVANSGLGNTQWGQKIPFSNQKEP